MECGDFAKHPGRAPASSQAAINLRNLRLRDVLNNAEEIAVGILQDNEVSVRRVFPRIASSPKAEKSFHFPWCVARIQVEVNPASLPGALVWCLVQRYVWPSSGGVAEDGPAFLRWVLRNVMEHFLPEGEHSLEFVASDDYGSDLQARGLPIDLHVDTLRTLQDIAA